MNLTGSSLPGFRNCSYVEYALAYNAFEGDETLLFHK